MALKYNEIHFTISGKRVELTPMPNSITLDPVRHPDRVFMNSHEVELSFTHKELKTLQALAKKIHNLKKVRIPRKHKKREKINLIMGNKIASIYTDTGKFRFTGKESFPPTVDLPYILWTEAAVYQTSRVIEVTPDRKSFKTENNSIYYIEYLHV